MSSSVLRLVRRAPRVAAPVALAGGMASCFAPTNGGDGGGGAQSHFHVQLNDTNVTVDCTKYDNSQQTYSAALISVGAESASTSETFEVYLPNGAAALRDPSALGKYPLANGYYTTGEPVAFELQLILYDPAAPEPNTSPPWDSCAPGSCGAPTPDPSHYHQITAITEQASSTPGMATFRVSGSFVALVAKQQAGSATATATGDWSLLVTVPDPGQ